jgi:predicted alpha/beta-hydrolase family hydrolase
VTDRSDIKVYPTTAAAAVFVLAHGAGAGQSSPFITAFARGMAERGITTATFDFPYMTAGRKVPDHAPVLEAHWLRIIERTRSQVPAVPLFIGGKSMGGRIASQVAAGDHPPIAGLVFLGYPLHPPGRPDKLRDAHLPRIAEPMLFVQGARDTFGTTAEIRALLPRMQKATLHEVAGGDHSFKVSGTKAKPADVMTGIMNVVADWMKAATARP